MGLSRGEAYEMLELPIGADPDSIRTSYKRLALKYHPTKNASSLEASTRFNEISLAYKRLVTDSENVQISPDQSMELFQQMFAPKHTTYTNGYAVDNSTDEDEDDSDDDDDDDYNAYLSRLHLRQDGTSGRKLTAEEIEKNANELITEEEKEKRRAEKRRAKKKRRREKKRVEKQKIEQKKDDDQKKKPGKIRENGESSTKPGPKKGSSGSEAEDFDPTAAFFTQVVNKKKKPGGASDAPTPTRQKQAERLGGKDEENVEDIDPVVLRSRHLAIRGNEMANLGHYQVAIDLFSEAVKLDPRDFRFFGNRSYCYDRMQQYERALKDADKAITLAKDWPKGYFRKGRALAGMKLYADAEQSFMQVLKLDRNCEDAMQELLRVRTHQLTEMGFTKAQAEQAIRQHGTVQTALETLLAGAVAETSLADEVYVSDEEDYSTPGAQSAAGASASSVSSSHQSGASAMSHHNLHQPHGSKGADVKMDPTNPEGLTALWVGNVLPEVTDKKLRKMFSEYGQVLSVRLLPEKYCAFINFKTKESAGRAMHTLQGMECAGQRLLIKFPDNPLSNGNTVLRKGPATNSTTAAPTKSSSATSPTSTTANKPQRQQPRQQQPQQPQQQLDDKLSGPVNGDECYFWRTTGCQFGKNCHYRHIPDHKGVDKKPWQKSMK